jgi:hypothetical protein
VSPDQIDAATNALVNVTAAVDTYGPGIGLTAVVAVILWAGRRITGRITRRRRNRRDRAAAGWIQYANPPRRQTTHGTDADELRTCNAILRATETREEQP